MKKIICFVVIAIVIGVVAVNLPKHDDYDYLRIHIRANSNCQIDQDVKYKVKDCLVQYLTPELCYVKSKQQAEEIVESEKQNLQAICNGLLAANGLNYKANVRLSNEYFPTRTYSNTTLESGYYDAIIVELGDAVGDNWWCVVYPPLCFSAKEDYENVRYKSRFEKWLKNIFG